MTAPIIVLAAILLGPPFFIAAVVSLLYWYEAGNSPPCPITAPCRRRPARCAIMGFCSCLASQMFTIGVYILGFIPPLWRPARSAQAAGPHGPSEAGGADANEPGRPAVILIHGLYHNPGAFIRYRRVLRRAGFHRHYMPRYVSYGAKTFEAIAAELKAKVLEIMDRDGPVLLVGHSMGGLFIRSLLTDPAVGDRVLGAVTLGTPHQGSKLAVLAFGASGKAITHQSPLIKRLAREERQSGVPRLSLASPMDDMVLPAAALTPPPGWELELTDPVGHVFMLYHKPVIRRVMRFLEDAAAGRLTRETPRAEDIRPQA